jgi:hypothetical protein
VPPFEQFWHEQQVDPLLVAPATASRRSSESGSITMSSIALKWSIMGNSFAVSRFRLGWSRPRGRRVRRAWRLSSRVVKPRLHRVSAQLSVDGSFGVVPPFEQFWHEQQLDPLLVAPATASRRSSESGSITMSSIALK